jgi:hypothetical protein
MIKTVRKPIRRRAAQPHQRRPYVVTLEPGDVLSFRYLRTRQSYSISMAACFELAIKAYVAQLRAQREARRLGLLNGAGRRAGRPKAGSQG